MDLDGLKDLMIKYKKWIIIGIIVLILMFLILLALPPILKFISNNRKFIVDLNGVKQKIEELGYKDINLAETNTKEELVSMLGVDVKDIDRFIVKPAGMRNKAYMYMVIKPTSGNLQKVKEKFYEYLENYDLLWKEYLPDQYELVKNKTYGETNGFLYVFVTENSREIEKEIKNELKYDGKTYKDIRDELEK